MTPADRPFRVLDLTTTLAGAYCAYLLAAGGVEVVRAEAPGGHPLRRWAAPPAAVPPGETGALFSWLAGGHASVVVDPDDPADVEELLTWAAAVDAIVWAPGAVVPLERVQAAARNVTITAVTPFGLGNEWSERPATEFTLQALTGAPGLRGSLAWPPLSAGGQHGEYMVGVFSAVATLLGLRQRVAGGGGGTIDLSGLESVMMTQLFNPHTMESQVGGIRPKRYKATVADVVESKDGYVGFAVVNRLQHWHDFCAMIEQPEWIEDRTLDPVVGRTRRSDELNPVIKAWTTARTTAEIVELANLMRIPCIEVGNGETIPKMDHFAEAGFYRTNPDGGFAQPAPPFRMHPPIPGVGENDPASKLGPPIRTATRPAGAAVPSPAAPARPRPDGSADPTALPLAGLRVADFTSFWAGPFLTHTLGLFGADVIHVESTGRPDGARLMNYHPVTMEQWWERSPYFHGTNTNKKDITLDLSQEAGRELARRLVAECDVIVENYSPRVMESFGLSWDEVREIKPDAVMVRMPAFGLVGPWRDRTGFAMTMEQVSGMAWLCGFPDTSPGALFGPCDPGAGLHALTALLAALEHRRRTGEGRLVECPMVANALNVAAEQVITASAYGVRLDRMGNRGLKAAPQNSYATADWDDDLEQHRFVSLAVETDEQWDALKNALGRPAWAERPELDHVEGRRARHDELDRELAAWFAARKAAEAVDQLWAAGVPTAPVVHPSENLEMAPLLARGFFEHVEHPVHGDSIIVTFPFKLPGAAGPAHRRPAPLLGEHNEEILGGLLGLSPEELQELSDAGVIGTAVTL